MIHITTKRQFETGTKVMVDGIPQEVIEVDFSKGLNLSVEVPGLRDDVDEPVILTTWLHWSEMANITINND